MTLRVLRIAMCIVSVLVSAPRAPCQGAGASVSYVMEVVDPGAHLMRVCVALRGLPGPAVSLALSPDIEIASVKAVSAGTGAAAGMALEIRRDGGHFRFALPKGGDADISYVLAMNQWKDSPGHGPRGYLCDGYLLGSVQWALLVPDDVPVARFGVRFKLPAGWKAVTPWRRSGDGFEETDAGLFRQATFAAGHFEERQRVIGGTQVRVAVDLRHEESFRSRLFDQSFEIFGAVRSLFAATGLPSHLTVFVKPEGPAEWQFLNESGSSHGEAVSDLKSAAYQCAHRVFHSFNAFYPAGMAIGPTWFLEGVDEYYCRLAMAAARVEFPLAGLREIYEGSYLPLRARYDAPLTGNLRHAGDHAREDFLAYKKGALVAALLDREIAGASGGRRSLADLLKALYARHGGFRGGDLTEEAIEAEAARTAGRDLKAFFDAHIRGVAPLAMDSLFSDDDLDGICALGERWLGTGASTADSDGDLASDACEFFSRTDPLDASDKPRGDVFVDGFDPEWRGLAIHTKGAVSVLVDGRTVCVRLSFPGTAALVSREAPARWYLNVDSDGDYASDLQFAAVPRSQGDWSKFAKGGVTYDYRPLIPGATLASAVARVAEFRIPREILGARKRLRFSAGIWDTTTGSGLASADWMEMELPPRQEPLSAPAPAREIAVGDVIEEDAVDHQVQDHDVQE